MGLHWGLEELVDKKISVTFVDLSITLQAYLSFKETEQWIFDVFIGSLQSSKFLQWKMCGNQVFLYTSCIIIVVHLFGST
jgi:hypothetical protein